MVNLKRKEYNNAQNWSVTQKYIRIEHNKAVVKWFRGGGSTARENLRNSILIYVKDTANQVLVKIQFFANYINRTKSVEIAIPLQFQTKKLAGVAQLAVIYRPVDKNNISGDYTLNIPHYGGNKNPKFTSHKKGNYWAKFTCRDSASIMVYCSSKAESIRVAKELNRYVDKQYKSEEISPSTGYMNHEPFKTIEVKPIRADYYASGKKYSLMADSRYYLDK